MHANISALDLTIGSYNRNKFTFNEDEHPKLLRAGDHREKKCATRLLFSVLITE